MLSKIMVPTGQSRPSYVWQIMADSHSDITKIKASEQNVARAEYSRNYHDGRNEPAYQRNWFGLEGGRQAVIHSFQYGWVEGEDRLDRLRREIKGSVGKLKGSHRRARKASTGDELDIHEVYRGNLEKAWEKH